MPDLQEMFKTMDRRSNQQEKSPTFAESAKMSHPPVGYSVEFHQRIGNVCERQNPREKTNSS
jgi:hypothetical protein